MLRCVRAQYPAASRPPAERTKSPRRPPAAQATPVGPHRQRPLPGSRQPVQASSRSRQRFRHAVAARQGSRPPHSSHGDRVVCRRRPRRWSRPYQSIWPVPRGSFYEPAAVHNGGSARGYQSSLCTVGYPTTAEPTGGQAVCLCIASTGRDRASAADSESPELPRVGRSTSVSVCMGRALCSDRTRRSSRAGLGSAHYSA